MELRFYLFTIGLFVARNWKGHYLASAMQRSLFTVLLVYGSGLLCQATPTKGNQPTEQTALKKEVPTENEGDSTDSLEEIFKKDATTGGIICNVLSGLALCYNALANLLLYPIFSFLLLALSLGALVLAYFWMKKIKAEQPIAPSWVIVTSFYLLCYLDLFLIVFQKKQVLLLFLELEKDLLLVSIAIGVGYVAGKLSSSKSFEQKKLP
ncbi:MAG: hypothetical protein NQ127_02550 [Candidatus Cardinium sp.]|nr:hypothetical protein [Candidatus Cardinium sp.]